MLATIDVYELELAKVVEHSPGRYSMRMGQLRIQGSADELRAHATAILAALPDDGSGDEFTIQDYDRVVMEDEAVASDREKINNTIEDVAKVSGVRFRNEQTR